MNVAYKHLESKLRIAELTIGQWLGIFVGVMLGIWYCLYLHPFGAKLTLFSGVYVAGIPICAVFLANMSDVNLWLLVASAARFRGADGRYLPGAGAPTPGYRLTVGEDPIADREQRLSAIDFDALWGER